MRRTIRTLTVASFVGLLLWAMALASGCTAEAEAPEADGPEVVEGACAQCHDATRIYLLQTEMPDWEAIVARMTQEHGAAVSAEEQAAVVEYLENQ